MNRRKFLASLGIAPFAPALAKVVPPVVEAESLVTYTPFVQREIYLGNSLVQMIVEAQKRTNKAMIENIAANHWSDIDERL